VDLGATGEEAKAAYDNLTNLWTRASTEDLGKRMALVEHSRQKKGAQNKTKSDSSKNMMCNYYRMEGVLPSSQNKCCYGTRAC
jgi:hypothetical protein